MTIIIIIIIITMTMKINIINNAYNIDSNKICGLSIIICYPSYAAILA